MVLEALAIDPRRPWKGPWRAFHEGMLDCCRPLEEVRREGVTLPQAACLARCNGAAVEMVVADADNSLATLEAFRAAVADAAGGSGRYVIASYSRKALNQTGDGHFSPVGAYDPASDQVLILDAARFKYAPHWVPLAALHAAMAPHDSVTGRPRGFLLLAQAPRPASVLFTLDVRDAEAAAAARAWAEGGLGAAAAAASAGASAAELVAGAAAAAPAAALARFVAVRAAGGAGCVQTAAVETFLSELRSMEIFSAVEAALGVRGGAEAERAAERAALAAARAAPPTCACGPEDAAADAAAAAAAPPPAPAVPGGLLAERAAVLLLAAPPGAWAPAGAAAAQAVEELLRGRAAAACRVVGAEVEFLRAQWAELDEFPAGGGSEGGACCGGA
jgi:hypothetical protein